MTESSSSIGEPSWWRPGVIGLLVVLGCLTMLSASSAVDTARDAYNAWQIASGAGFPLEGPHVGGVFHGGPAWFYLLALPLLVAPGWIAMYIWVGLLTGMKYALAYACGTRLIDRTFGLLWACLLALPDWTSVNYLIFSHTNLVETAVLLIFYSLVRWQEGSGRWFLVMCLAIGLGIHAHPTVYAAGLVAVPFVVRSLWRKTLSWWLVPAGLLTAVLPLTPYLVSQSLRQWPDLQTGTGYFDSQPLLANLQGLGDVARGALIDGPVVALGHVLGLSAVPLVVAGVILGLIVAGGLILAVHAMIRRSAGPAPVLLLLTTLVCIAAVALIRNVTPFYQTFVIYPPFYGLVALGWWHAARSAGRLVVGTLVVLGCASLSAMAVATFQIGREGDLRIPQTSLMDVRTHAVGEFADTVYYPGWGRRQLGSFICAQNEPVYFHGFASLVLEQSYALEARMLCDADDVYLGGQGAGRHYLGISRRDSRKLGIRPENTLGSMNLYEVGQVVAPAEPVPVPVGDDYPPRSYLSSGESRRVLDTVAAPGAATRKPTFDVQECFKKHHPRHRSA